MTEAFTRTKRQGETWTWLTPTRLMISHPDRDVIVVDVDGPRAYVKALAESLKEAAPCP